MKPISCALHFQIHCWFPCQPALCHWRRMDLNGPNGGFLTPTFRSWFLFKEWQRLKHFLCVWLMIRPARAIRELNRGSKRALGHPLSFCIYSLHSGWVGVSTHIDANGSTFLQSFKPLALTKQRSGPYAEAYDLCLYRWQARQRINVYETSYVVNV